MADDKLLKTSEVMDITGYSRTTLWRRVQDKEIPEPIKLPKGKVRWSNNELMAWIEELKSNRHAA